MVRALTHERCDAKNRSYERESITGKKRRRKCQMTKQLSVMTGFVDRFWQFRSVTSPHWLIPNNT